MERERDETKQENFNKYQNKMKIFKDRMYSTIYKNTYV